MRFPPSLKNGVKKGAALKALTTFRIGGPAEILVSPQGLEELRRFVLLFREHGVPVRVIGAGSNILCSDAGVRGAVLKLDAAPFRRVSVRGTRVRAGAGVPLQALLQRCCREGLSGMEFLAGIPGTVGGALAMNCGVSATGGYRSIGDSVESVRLMGRDGNVAAVPKEKISFAYRHSGLGRGIIIEGCFSLKRSSPGRVRAALEEWRARRAGQEYAFPSAGCVFRNPAQGVSAGRLIDECGLKGHTIGGARVSEKHANFIVNTGTATCSDVLKLMCLVRRRVKLCCGMTLTPEIKIWK